MSESRTIDPSRRDVLAAAAVGACAAIAPVAEARAHGASVSGVVFEDRTGKRMRQGDDPGIAGVMVSNGRDVVVTDRVGRYTLPLPDEATIFVVKPAGYMPPVDFATQLPQFYRHHQPAGTPAGLRMAFPGIEPTGRLPLSLDFPLRRQEEHAQFDVALLTDPQPRTDAEVDFIREDVIDALAHTGAKFGITAGDVMFDDLSLYDRYNRIVGTTGIPWWNLAGNHDLNYEAQDRRYAKETFRRVYGPAYHAFEYGRATFLMLDDVDYLGDGRYEGRLDRAQLDFFRNVLANTPEDRLVVAVMHIPLRSCLDPQNPSENLVNRADLFALLQGRPNTVSFAGHTHTTEHHYFGAQDGWSGAQPHHHHVLTAVCGSWWSGPYDHRGVACADSCDGTPNGFHILSIDGVAYRTRFVPAKEPNGRQVRLSLDSPFHTARRENPRDYGRGQLLGSPIDAALLATTNLTVNVFDGGPKTIVAVTFDDRLPVMMTHVNMVDPFIADVFSQNAATIKPWVKAEISSHIWTAPLPIDLSSGAHRVLVTAVNEYGVEVSGRAALEIVG